MHKAFSIGGARALKRAIWILAVVFTIGFVEAGPLRVSTAEPIIVSAPNGWKIAKDRPPTAQFPFETYKIFHSDGRNAACMISVIGKNREQFADKDLLKKVVAAQARAFVRSENDLAEIEMHDLKVEGGLGLYADFADPNLVGKPAKKGDYKVATPIVVSLGTKYLLQITILTDDTDGEDHRELVNIVKTIREIKLI
jgi:hypothetical protein